MNITLTRHAMRRIQQRGTPAAVVQLVVDKYDRDIPVGAGCSAVWISRQEALALRYLYPSQLVDAAGRHAAVLNGDGEVVTVIKMQSGKAGRPYRKGRM